MIPYASSCAVKSAFSFFTGTAQPELAARRGALATARWPLTDQSGLYGLPRFAKAAQQAGLRPFCGAELRVDGYPLLFLVRRRRRLPESVQADHAGKDAAARPGTAAQDLTLTALARHTSGLIALTGGQRRAYRCSDRSRGRRGSGGSARSAARNLRRKNLAVELQVHFEESEDRRNATLCELSHRYEVPLVLTNDVRMTGPDKLLCCDVLTCVREGVTLAAAGTRLFAQRRAPPESPAEMAALLPELPAAVAYSAELAARCRFTLADLGYRFPTSRCRPATASTISCAPSPSMPPLPASVPIPKKPAPSWSGSLR